MEELAYMASGARDEFTDVVENVTSRQGKLAETQGAQTESQQRAEQSKQDSLIDVSREGSAKPARRKGKTKATKRTQQAPQTPGPTEKSKVKVSGPSDEVIAAVPQTTNDASAPAIDTARADFVADPEPIPRGGGFLCTFTLSRPGLVGLNKLAIYLNNLQDSGSIGGWQANGWEDAATKARTLIRFVDLADAIIAIKGVH
jgi:hypothetical protein